MPRPIECGGCGTQVWEDTVCKFCFDKRGEIIAKLSETADGVKITPGMHVFLPGYVGNGEVEYVGNGSVVVNEGITWPENPNGRIAGFGTFHPNDLYSTCQVSETTNPDQIAPSVAPANAEGPLLANHREKTTARPKGPTTGV